MSKVIWITGAGSGIGKALVEVYAYGNNTIILSGRNKQKLEEAVKSLSDTQASFEIVEMDISNRDDIAQAVSQVVGTYKYIDVLINNAGASQRALAIDTNLDVSRTIMEVNFFGTVALTKEVLPYMLKRNKGNIAVVTSISGIFGFPQRSSYSASKHALHGYFESLALELKDTGVHITLAVPGRINTDISLNALKADGTKHAEVDRAQSSGMPALKCARQIKKAIDSNKPEKYIGGKEILMVYFKRFIPSLFRKIAGSIKPNG